MATFTLKKFITLFAAYNSVNQTSVNEMGTFIFTRPWDVVEKTDNYTLVLDDAGRSIQMNKGSGVALTVPPNASVAFPIGTQIRVEQTGAGALTIAAGAGVTINVKNTLVVSARYGVVYLVKRATNTWTLSGDTTA